MPLLDIFLSTPSWLGGGALVRAALPLSSQRHKCSNCGKTEEVILLRVVNEFACLLTDSAFIRLFPERCKLFLPAQRTPFSSTTQAASCASYLSIQDSLTTASSIVDEVSSERELCTSSPKAGPLPKFPVNRGFVGLSGLLRLLLIELNYLVYSIYLW
jgi:hypothetical protein